MHLSAWTARGSSSTRMAAYRSDPGTVAWCTSIKGLFSLCVLVDDLVLLYLTGAARHSGGFNENGVSLLFTRLEFSLDYARCRAATSRDPTSSDLSACSVDQTRR